TFVTVKSPRTDPMAGPWTEATTMSGPAPPARVNPDVKNKNAPERQNKPRIEILVFMSFSIHCIARFANSVNCEGVQILATSPGAPQFLETPFSPSPPIGGEGWGEGACDRVSHF